MLDNLLPLEVNQELIASCTVSGYSNFYDNKGALIRWRVLDGEKKISLSGHGNNVLQKLLFLNILRLTLANQLQIGKNSFWLITTTTTTKKKNMLVGLCSH